MNPATLAVRKDNQSVVWREIIAVSSEIHIKSINTLFGQNLEFLNVKASVA